MHIKEISNGNFVKYHDIICKVVHCGLAFGGGEVHIIKIDGGYWPDDISVKFGTTTVDALLHGIVASPDELQPIPITEEWLEMNNFEKNIHRLTPYILKLGGYEIEIKRRNNGSFVCFIEHDGEFSVCKIDFIHQLQQFLTINKIDLNFNF